MNARQIANAAAFAACAFVAPAQAASAGPGAVECGSSLSTVFAAGYAGQCQGPLAGALGSGGISHATFGGQSYTLAGSTRDASGRFNADPGSVQWGELFLSAPQTGNFVLGLQGGDSYSLYLFNGGSAGLSAIEFDTQGLARITDSGFGGLVAPGLTQATLFTSAVPEPGAYALMLAGLAVLTSLSRSAPLRRAEAPMR